MPDTTKLTPTAWLKNSTYQALRDNLLLANEDNRSRLYLDTRGIPTLGDGIALVVKNNGWKVDTDAVKALGSSLSQADRANLDEAARILNETRLDEPKYPTDGKNNVLRRPLGCFEISTRGTLEEMAFGDLDGKWQPTGWNLQPGAAAMQSLRTYKAGERERTLLGALDDADLIDTQFTASQMAGLLSMVWQGREDAAKAAARAIADGKDSNEICKAAAGGGGRAYPTRLNAECSALTNGAVPQYITPKATKTFNKADLGDLVDEAIPYSSTVVAGGTAASDAEALANAIARQKLQQGLAEFADRFDGETYDVALVGDSLLLSNDTSTLEIRRDGSAIVTEAGGLVTESRLVDGHRLTVTWTVSGSDWDANALTLDGAEAGNSQIALAALDDPSGIQIADGDADDLLRQVAQGQTNLVRTTPDALTTTTLSPSGQLQMTVDRQIDGHLVKLEFIEDEWGELQARRVVSVDGTPIEGDSFSDLLNYQGYDAWAFADGATPAGSAPLDALFKAYNPLEKQGLQTLVTALTRTSDALSLLSAIQSGKPLPILASGLRLAATIPGAANDAAAAGFNLSGVSSAVSGVLSLMSLDQALKHGDTIGAVTAGAKALSFASNEIGRAHV